MSALKHSTLSAATVALGLTNASTAMTTIDTAIEACRIRGPLLVQRLID